MKTGQKKAKKKEEGNVKKKSIKNQTWKWKRAKKGNKNGEKKLKRWGKKQQKSKKSSKKWKKNWKIKRFWKGIKKLKKQL